MCEHISIPVIFLNDEPWPAGLVMSCDIAHISLVIVISPDKKFKKCRKIAMEQYIIYNILGQCIKMELSDVTHTGRRFHDVYNFSTQHK